MAGICAVIQAVVKVRAHRQLTRLHRELDLARQGHIEAMQIQHERQRQLCADLGLPEPPLPEILQPQPEPDAAAKRRFRIPVSGCLSGISNRCCTSAPRGSSAFIVGRYGASFAASTVWKTSSGNILRLLSPVTSRLSVLCAPRCRVLRPGLLLREEGLPGPSPPPRACASPSGAISIVGLVVGPALTAWAVYRELRKVRRARQEHADTLAQFSADLDAMMRRTAELEAQAICRSPPGRS